MLPLKKILPENIHAIARNPNIALQPILVYSKSDLQHHNRTQQLQELLTKMNISRKQSIDQNLRKLVETVGFSDFINKITADTLMI